MIIIALGTVLVLVSRKSWLSKTLVVAAPVLFVAWSFSQSFAPSQTFLFPEGFSGRFIVVEGEPCGLADRKEDGRFIIEVPSSGIVILQRPARGGWVDDKFFIVGKDGVRSPITQSIAPLNAATIRPSVMLGGSGSVGGLMSDGSSSTESAEAINFSDYYVLTADSNASFYDQAFDDMMVRLVKECRAIR